MTRDDAVQTPLNPAANPRIDQRHLMSALPFKTLAGFLAALLAVLVISFVSYRSLEARSEGARQMAKTQQAVRQVDVLLSLLKDAETGQRGYLLTGAERYLAPYDAAVRDFPHKVEETRRAIIDDAGQAERLGRLEGLVNRKLLELKETIDLRRAGHPQTAIELVHQDRGQQLMEDIRTLTLEMRIQEERELQARTETWERIAAMSTQLTWGGSIVLFALIAAAFVMSANDFRTQQVEAWIRTGQSELSRVVQGEKDLSTLGGAVGTLLARYLGAQIGVIHAADQQELTLVGGWGLPELQQLDKRPGSANTAPGLALQAFKENRPVHVRDVPADYFPVSSGVGRTLPGELIIVPTTSDGVTNGVLEFGFFRPVRPHEIELLNRASETVGTAFRSAKYRARLRNLLEETQRQAEELQSQQEELRVNNEELEQQTKALQDSQAQLERQQTDLEHINSQLAAQTQSLELQKSDLKRAQTELQRANDYKSEFLANMSHELRTPLNSSLILAKLLVNNKDGNLSAEQVKFAQTIYSAGNDLLTLINDILDLSKIEAGQLDIRPEIVPVPRLVDELQATFQPVAKDRGLELTMTVEQAVPVTIDTDPLRLSQIIKNLLSNALKFTERGGVSLHVSATPDQRVAFAVKDTGIGIPREQQGVIFEAFRQADGTTNRKYGGSGLGLSISRDLAQLLGGEISVQSTPGRGSTFTLVVPTSYVEPVSSRPRTSHAHTNHTRQTEGAATQWTDHSRTTAQPLRPSDSSARSPNAAHGADPASVAELARRLEDDRDALAAGSRSLLIIEDDLKFAQILRDLAHELEFQVIMVQSADSGLAAAERYRPSAIVLDVGLPDRSGLSVLDTLKHNPATRHIPVHVISASDYVQTALEMGAAGYAIKPVRREELVDALKRLEYKFTQKQRRVLVVEDDPTHRESTCHLIASDDVQCVAVGTAREALEQLRLSTFDCMILDLSLPDRTGFELLSEMSQQEQYGFPPVIIYTGRSLSREEDQQLRRFSSSIIIKGARSPERLLDEVTLFLHQVESELPADRQRMLRDARHREKVFEGRRVLIVEDDVRNIFALTSVLEPKGAKVEIARNGREALDHISQHPGVDLVLMDIMMPEMDGLQAMRELRKQPEHAKLPIIALTAKAMADDRDNCLAAGANDYIAKPLDVDKLLSLARVWMPK